MADDTLILPVLDALRACLCEQLAVSPGGVPCFCGLYPGGPVPADGCTCGRGATGCGQAWVRLARVFPTTQYPQQTNTPGCAVGLAAVIEVGVRRCLPGTSSINGQVTFPTAADQAEAVRVQMGDLAAILRAITCCPALARMNPILGAYAPEDAGDCGGGVWPVTVQLG